MKAFAHLFNELDASTATGAKVDALKRYFGSAAPPDAAWAVYFLAGGKPRQVVPTALLRALACEQAGIAPWLFEEAYQAVGDLAETIAHVLPPATALSDVGLAEWVERRLLPLRGADPLEQAQRIARYWGELDTGGRFLLTKLIGGGMRVGVSKLLVQRALAEVAGLDPKLVAQRMMGYTDAKQMPDAARYEALSSRTSSGPADAGQPYPFFLAHQLDAPLVEFDQKLGSPANWFVEWKYDGIRAQLVFRGGSMWVWSRGEELVTDRFPEFAGLLSKVPAGTVIDGEILVWLNHAPAPFALLQQRIGRKNLTAKVLREAPVVLLAYDLLESDGVDRRGEPLDTRRARLEAIIRAANDPRLLIAPVESAATWRELETRRSDARERGVEGFMLKQRSAPYGVGRTKDVGVWWKWKIDPLSVDAVLIYAQRGHGRRASLYTDYTFAVWDRPDDGSERQLVPFAKAYSGLTDAEFRQVDAIINKTTLEKFGPVRSVTPTLVFELGFEGIQRSARHKSGIAVRFPRMLRWRQDKPVAEADTLAMLEDMLR